MAIKNYNPTTPAQRGYISVARDALHKGKPIKCLVQPLISKAGRNNKGHITVRRRGGGHKRAYRLIDFRRNKFDVAAKVERLEYDPNRTAYIALLQYADGIYSYIIAPSKLNVGDKISSSKKMLDIKPGNAMPLAIIPVGALVHNVEAKPGAGGILARSAGTFAQLAGKDNGYAILKLQSGEIKKFPLECLATIGVVSNADNKNSTIGKAGRSRWKGIRPHVRGESMNPVDHPHGGRTRGGRLPVSPTGVCAKGGRTRKKNSPSNKFIVKSRHKK